MYLKTEKPIAWELFIMGILCLIVGMFSSCSSTKKVKTDRRTMYDSASYAGSVSVRVTSIKENGTVPVIVNPGNTEVEFNPDDTCSISFENEFYQVQVTPGKKATNDKPAQPGKVKVTGKDKEVKAPINRETTIKETTTAAQQATVHKEEETHSKDKQSSGIPWYAWLIGSVLILFVVYILIKTFTK